MQEVINTKGFDPASRFHFAHGRNYMMRSEKRGGSGPSHHPSAPGGRPPRRRRRAGFFYKFFTVLLLLVLWPVGLMLLWRRRLRWGAATKLLTSIVTLAACVVLIGFALTVNTGNARYTAVQDSVNNFLDNAADALIDVGGVVGDKAVQVWDGASDFADALWTGGKTHLANGIDWGVEQAESLKSAVRNLLPSKEENAPEDAASPAPDAEETEAPDPSSLPSEAPTSAPVVEVRVDADADALPLYIPEVAPDASLGTPVVEGTLSRSAVLKEGPLPTPKPTPEPTPEPLIFTVKPASDATVYYFDSSKFYHMSTNCGSMKGAPAHSFGEAVESGHRSCNGCKSPDAALLEEEAIVWLDANGLAHLSNECPDFKGAWRLSSARSAADNQTAACAECDAARYLAAIAAGEEVTILNPGETTEPTEEPTKEPTAEPTEVPTEEPTVEPATEATEKPAAGSTKAPSASPTPVPTLKPTAKPAKTPAAKASPAA